jgi:hypothetical protein
MGAEATANHANPRESGRASRSEIGSSTPNTDNRTPNTQPMRPQTDTDSHRLGLRLGLQPRLASSPISGHRCSPWLNLLSDPNEEQATTDCTNCTDGSSDLGFNPGWPLLLSVPIREIRGEISSPRRTKRASPLITPMTRIGRGRRSRPQIDTDSHSLEQRLGLQPRLASSPISGHRCSPWLNLLSDPNEEQATTDCTNCTHGSSDLGFNPGWPLLLSVPIREIRGEISSPRRATWASTPVGLFSYQCPSV